MEYYGPYCYTLYLTGAGQDRAIRRKVCGGVECDFKSPVTSSKQPKIYILMIRRTILYVGYTSQSIGSRFYAGLKADGENGYHGYQLRKHDVLKLIIFCFKPFS